MRRGRRIGCCAGHLSTPVPRLPTTVARVSHSRRDQGPAGCDRAPHHRLRDSCGFRWWPVYLMEHIAGCRFAPVFPASWAVIPEAQRRRSRTAHRRHRRRARRRLGRVGLGDMLALNGISNDNRALQTQLHSYGGRDTELAEELTAGSAASRPADRPLALCHGDYKLDNVLFALDAPPRLLASSNGRWPDRRPAHRPRVGADLSSRGRHHGHWV